MKQFLFFGETSGEVGGDQLAKLSEDWQFCCGWFTVYHQGDPERDRSPATLKKLAMGWLWI